MKALARFTAAFALIIGLGVGISAESATGCLTRAETKSVVDNALTDAQIFCVVASALIDIDAIMTACRIVNKPGLRELLDMLVGQREAARSAGFRYVRPEHARDAGSK